MIRVAFLLLVIVAAILLGWRLIETDQGAVHLEWFGYEIDTTALFASIVFVVFMAAALPLLRMLMFLMDAPGRIGKASKRARQRRGQEALAMGLIAAEAGDFEEAQKQAAKAEDMIEEPRLAALLQARAAEVAGDYASAERVYSGMLSDEDTELLGRKGLMAAALKRGDRLSALAHADAALKASKSATWPFQYAFDLKVQHGDWEGALETLEIGDKRKLIEEKVEKRRRAVLMAACASKMERDRRPEKAADLAQKAFRTSPGFAPAAALASRLLVAEGKTERAASILEDAWENAPHPALAHAYRDLTTNETPEQRYERMMGLVEKRREHRESKIIVGELAIERGDWSAAQAALDDAYRENPSSRICILFAQIARGRGDENAARTWLAQAAAAPRELDWSDLDPEGPAFLYEDGDWARLVYAYGDAGHLIHPRLERGGVDAAVTAAPRAAIAPPQAQPAPSPTPADAR